MKENWCISFALVFLIALIVWVVLDYLHTGKIDFRSVLIAALGFSVGWSIANKKKKKLNPKFGILGLIVGLVNYFALFYIHNYYASLGVECIPPGEPFLTWTKNF